jgi:hypothetical protein
MDYPALRSALGGALELENIVSHTASQFWAAGCFP